MGKALEVPSDAYALAVRLENEPSEVVLRCAPGTKPSTRSRRG